MTIIKALSSTIITVSSEISVTVPTTGSGEFIIVYLMHRDTITSVPDGFSLFESISFSDSGTTQYTSVYYGVSSSSNQVITFNQASSQRFIINAVVINGDSSSIYLDEAVTTLLAGTVPSITPIGDCYLGFTQSYIYAESSGTSTISLTDSFEQTTPESVTFNRMVGGITPLEHLGGVEFLSENYTYHTSTNPSSDCGGIVFAIYGAQPALSDYIQNTQAATLVLCKEGQPVRTTQAAVLVLDNPSYPIHTTQAAALVLDKPLAQLGVTQSAVLALVTHTPCLTQRCQCWKITRQDGMTFAFTTHDDPVTWHNLTYKPCYSLSATASESGIIGSSGAGDTSFSGHIDDSSISEHDLANGLFDGAKVEVWLVPWSDMQMRDDNVQLISKGVLGKTTHGRLSYTAEMLTPASKLTNRPLLDTYTAACRWEFGDGRCPVDKEALKVSSAVTYVEPRNAIRRATYRRFSDSSLTQNDGYFDFGFITWLTGNNAGLTSEVKSYVGGTITLWAAMEYEIEVGDTYEITPGCDKTKDSHINKFGLDMVDFGGFPDIPGTDILVRTPDAK